MTMAPLVIERTFDASPQAIWSALTSKEKIAKWFVPFSDFKAQPGFEFSFMGVTKEGTPKKHLCRVVEAIPNEKLSYTWRYEGHPGDSLVTWDLIPEGTGTNVRITHAGLETFPAMPAFARENYQNGWTHIIGTLQALVKTE